MKIFNSFDTKLDEKELSTAITKYGEWNAILTKKHRIYLLLPLILLCGSIWAFALLMRFSYKQYIDNTPRLFWIIAVCQLCITLARIVHSIQTIFTTIKKHKWKAYFGKISQNGLKEWKFEHYLKHSFISLILQVLLMITDCVFVIIFAEHWIKERLMFFGWLLLNILFIFIIYKTIYTVIDYEMRFNIFTPDSFYIHRQKTIFKMDTISIPTEQIKWITEIQGWLGSILWYSKIAIFRQENNEPTKIAYVTKASSLIKKLNELSQRQLSQK